MKWICILPIGDIDQNLLDELSRSIEAIFKRRTRILERREKPHFAFDAKRKQYLSIPVLGRVLQCADEGAEKIVGITDVDICVPVLQFVFGQAQLSGKAALVSIARLQQQFYGLPEDRGLLADRAKKETVHELGHTYGLVHCRNSLCVMHYSNSLREVDSRPLEFCDGCLDLLREETCSGEDQ
jgi:archaemetzincin